MIFTGGPVRIVADDLTGALDAAAPFASPDRPVGLVLHDTEIPDRPVLTISSESRDGTAAEAQAATAHACGVLRAAKGGAGALWFHKVDSVLRGHPFLATAAMLKCLEIPKCLFAPAFPAMGRITSRGMHLVRNGNEWHAAAQSDIAAGLKAAGLNSVSEGTSHIKSEGVMVVDATTQADLDRAVARQEDHQLLWVGSRALAESLAGAAVPLPCPPLAILVIGTSHPASRAQVASANPQTEPAAETGPIRPQQGKCILIDPVANSADATATRAAVHQAVLRIDPSALEGRAMFVAGGDTLSVVLSAIGARSLDCLGEVGPGLPLAIVRGGTLDGCCLVSKSGGFGAPDLLSRMISAPKPIALP
ncbi:MAG: four-carbon acid sugar kinase family protein [Cypionkella sp.]